MPPTRNSVQLLRGSPYRKQSGWQRSVMMPALKGNVSAATELAGRAEGRPRPTTAVAHQEIGAGLIVRNRKNHVRDEAQLPGGHNNIQKRRLIHVGAFNLSLILCRLMGVGTPGGVEEPQRDDFFYSFMH